MNPRKLMVIAVTLALLCGVHSSARAGSQTQRAGSGKIVALVTNHGTIKVKLFRAKAPITTANFLKYVQSGFFNGTIFHRVISNFMVQGGGLTTSMVKKTTRAAITNEADNGLQNRRGTLAMARTGAPHSATAQFFINVKNNTFLNHSSRTQRGWGYCVFAEVIGNGMAVVDKIRYVATGTSGGRQNVPLSPVVIKRAYVVK